MSHVAGTSPSRRRCSEDKLSLGQDRPMAIAWPLKVTLESLNSLFILRSDQMSHTFLCCPSVT